MEVRMIPLNTLCAKWSMFSDDYLIADDGYIYHRMGGGIHKKLKSGYYRSATYPYQQVRGTFGSKSVHSVHVHRAVALAFCERPKGCTDVDHINGDKRDNRAVNLQWLTHKENVQRIKARKEQAECTE